MGTIVFFGESHLISELPTRTINIGDTYLGEIEDYRFRFFIVRHITGTIGHIPGGSYMIYSENDDDFFETLYKNVSKHDLNLKCHSRMILFEKTRNIKPESIGRANE